MIRALLVTLFLLFTTPIVTSTIVDNTAMSYVKQTNYITYIPWSKSNSGYWITYSTYSVYNDFDWMVSRSSQPDYYGYYYYYIWFYSQSFYWNGYDKKYTSTNLKNVKLYVNNYLTKVNDSGLGITFMNEFNATSLAFKSKFPNAKINIVWGNMLAK